MKKKDIKFIILFVVIACVSFIYLFQSAYGKYRKQVEGDVNAKIASWNILVNNENINGKNELTNYIEPTFVGDDYTNEGVIAPGSQGYYDIVIDPTQVDVAFSYTIYSDLSDESSVVDLVTTGYTINPDTNVGKTIYDSTTGISGTIAKDSSNVTIRVYIMWDDSEDNAMDNKTDTSVAIDSTSTALIKTRLRFSQVN